jgi:hypothetical protein
MKKIKYMLFVLSLFTTVGLAYATIVLKGMPDTFDMEDDNE